LPKLGLAKLGLESLAWETWFRKLELKGAHKVAIRLERCINAETLSQQDCDAISAEREHGLRHTDTIRGDAAPAGGEAIMAWAILVVAGVFETGWAIGLKFTEGFTKPVPSILTIVAMAVSMGLLGLAVRSLSVGTAYAVWTGIGSTGTVLLGIYLFGEPATAARLACIGLIVAGIVGLKFVG
jgi:quaternary ammonium compound-resistance protein SugE